MSTSTTASTDMTSRGLSGEPSIEVLRRVVDQLDARMIGILHARRHTSQRIQASKVESGQSRVDLARERQIIALYREELGPLGVAIAHAVLDFSKGN